MVARIARKEYLEIVRDGRFRAVAAIIGMLLVVALATGWRQYRDLSAQHERAQALTREHWLAQPAKDPHSAAHYGIYAFKPRLPLSLVDSGVDPYTGVAAWLEAHKQNKFQFRPAQDRSAVVRFGELTAATAMQWLMPLVVAFLAAEAFAGEREQGTLRQLLAIGVPRGVLVAGKLAGIAAATGVVAIPAVILGAVALVWTGGGDLQGWGERAAVLAAVQAVWLGIVAVLALAVSALAQSVRTALAAIVVFWALNVFVAPRVATEIARRLEPTPTSFAFAQAVHDATYDGLDVHHYTLRRSRELKARLLKQYGVARVEQLPVNFRGVDYLEREAQADATFDAAYGRLWATFDRQLQHQQRAAFVAPLMAVRSLSMAAAGTDVFHHRHFARAAEVYRRGLVRAMNEDLAHGSTSATLGYQAGADLWARLPAFRYHTPPLAQALAAQRTALLALACWAVAAAALLGLALARMRVG